jgi:nucleoside-diphosphate-sugar epimerase
MERKSILITGVYGLVGSSAYRRLAEKPDLFDVYGMDRHEEPSPRVHPDELASVPDERFFQSDLSDIDELVKAFQGMDTIVHLAGDPNADATWESLHKNNIGGTYNVFEAAKQSGVRRVIFASSIHVSFGYYFNVEPYRSISGGKHNQVPEDFKRITTSDPTWPVVPYGSSKVFGESLARMHSSESGLSCICLRLGGVQSMDKFPQSIVPNACSRNDVSRLIELCIQAPDTVKFEIFYGLSNSEYRWVDIENAAKILGYVPQDRIRLKD